MVYINDYNFKYSLDKIIKPEKSFIHLYVDKLFKSKITSSLTQEMYRILDAEYRKADMNKVMSKPTISFP